MRYFFLILFFPSLLMAAEDSACVFQHIDKCYSCDELKAIGLSVSKEEKDSDALKKCKNRNVYISWMIPHVFSVLKKCPKEMPLLNGMGLCFSCAEKEPVYQSFKKDFPFSGEYTCPNRVLIRENSFFAYSYISQCPKDKPLVGYHGDCYSCDTPLSINISENEVLCRRFCDGKRFFNGGYCMSCSFVPLNEYPNKDFCISCGGYWDKTHCRERREGDDLQFCHKNSDCAKDEICFYNRCKAFTEEEKKSLYGKF
ncbi:MAG: hypothetical protein EOM53_00540 [Alphaproteobacteria bacterium]|nr:hypothetical protein [Alphaproteobacteria bacterium]